MNVLVAGGLGYIGSHTVVALQKKGYKVTVIDDLSNSNKNTINNIKKITGQDFSFHQLNITEYKDLDDIFNTSDFNSILHFAAFKSVSESIVKPLKYYKNNIETTINLLKLSEKYNVYKFVFSSSATIYGSKNRAAKETDENESINNPYGRTKLLGEQIIEDFVKSTKNHRATSLRYFNPIGAHESGLIGEDSSRPSGNLMPYIVKTAAKEIDKIEIFGDDYPTRDGTGIRDYIHVMDLAEGHVAALEKMPERYNLYNLGTGKGTSVKELIKTFEVVNNVKVPYKISKRRVGDIAMSYADVNKIRQELGWSTVKTIEDMCRDSWKYKVNEGMEHSNLRRSDI